MPITITCNVKVVANVVAVQMERGQSCIGAMRCNAFVFFLTEAHENKVDEAETIYKVTINAGTMHMLLFVNYVRQKVNILNLEYQSANFRIHKVH